MMNAEEARWQRLQDSLDAAGISATISARSYPGGVSRHIAVRLADRGWVEVHDSWWSKNDAVWTGYVVHVEGPDSIVRRTWPRTKKRSDVVRAFTKALTISNSPVCTEN